MTQDTGIPLFDSKFQIEEHIRAKGLPYTIIPPVFFMENCLGGRAPIDKGVLGTPLTAEKPLQMIAVDDIGAFVALAFDHPRRWLGRAVDLAGDELTMTALAEAFSHACGHQSAYEQVPWKRFEQQVGRDYTTMWKWFQNVGYHVDIQPLRREYSKLKTLECWLAQMWTAPTPFARRQ